MKRHSRCHSGPLPHKVIVEEQSIYSTSPRESGTLPQECNYNDYLRYRLETAGGSAKPVNAILVLIPGYVRGTNGFAYFGWQVVSMTEQQGHGSIEVRSS